MPDEIAEVLIDAVVLVDGREVPVRGKLYLRRCPTCAAEFVATRPDVAFCGVNCANRASVARQSDARREQRLAYERERYARLKRRVALLEAPETSDLPSPLFFDRRPAEPDA
jgi:hypothetical protein